jgi:hypothetical protein
MKYLALYSCLGNCATLAERIRYELEGHDQHRGDISIDARNFEGQARLATELIREWRESETASGGKKC